MGVILFIMVAGIPPFGKAVLQDAFFKTLAGNRSDIFWAYHEKKRKYSPEFKELITSMLQLEPGLRPSSMEIMGHPWTQGQVPSEQEITQRFANRHV